MSDLPCRRYARRMLNPFHGIASLVETARADAVSRDGLNWTLYIQGERSLERGDDGISRAVQTPDIKYGTWSPKQGLTRAPVRSMADYAQVEQEGAELLQAIEASLTGLPFPLADGYELWLLDGETDLPLALIDSACPLEELSRDREPRWNPGLQARQSFGSPSLAQHTGVAPGKAHAEVLARVVADASGPRPRAQWFERGGDGSGVGLEGIALPPHLRGRRLNPGCFPELLLAEDWSSPWIKALVADFLAWQSPWLLLLQHLEPATRTRLEGLAAGRAQEIARQYRLYPEVVNPKGLTAALVEVRLRAASATESPRLEEELSPFYLET